MKDQQWTFLDRTGWPAGPWDSEPDKAQWTDAVTGLPCMIHRNAYGAWCGYVGVAPGHPAYANEYADIDAGVHGGLTFADRCDPTFDPATGGVCHLPEPGESDDVWWLGFNCGHAFDYQPGLEAHMGTLGCAFDLDILLFGELRIEYRDIEYVRAECAHLASQLHAQAS
ncbi:hypothetical protein B0G84_5714 [Paraburkholderia sp. BL8N3]|nr:hypothetical protein [Paraburkholderia sp. BL8N3]TCK36701.1 hypothetical protein B0G84_5714 [Paraburkholderia sp. BL8N3]